MRVYKDIDSLDEFEFWGQAVVTMDELSDDDKEVVFNAIDECYPDGIDETQLNDILAYDDDWIRELLGYDYSEYDSKEDQDEKQEEYIIEVLEKAFPEYDADDMQAYAEGIIEDCKYDDYSDEDFKDGFIDEYGEDHATSILMSCTDNEWENQIDNFVENEWNYYKSDEYNIKAFEKYLKEDEDYQQALKESYDEIDEDDKRHER